MRMIISGRVSKEKEVMLSLRVISQYIQRYSKTLQKNIGLSSSQLQTLWIVKDGQDVRVTDIAKGLSLHLSTTSNMLDTLEDKKLIKRVRESKDMRTVFIRLTKKGENILSKTPHPSEGKLAKALNAMTDKEINSLNYNHKKLIQALEKN